MYILCFGVITFYSTV